jgi:hypothetical protein
MMTGPGKVCAIGALLSACAGRPAEVDELTGYHAAGASISLASSPDRGSKVVAGTGWVVFLSAANGPTWGGLGLRRQTSVLLELDREPPVGEQVDVSSLRRVAYEYGGSALTHVLRTATGNASVTASSADARKLKLDLTFRSPLVGSGEVELAGEVDLAPAPGGLVAPAVPPPPAEL